MLHPWRVIVPKIGPKGHYFSDSLQPVGVDMHGRYFTKIEATGSILDKGWAIMYRFSGGLPGEYVDRVWQCLRCGSVIFAVAEESMSRARRHCNIPADCDAALIRKVMIS